MTIQRGTLPSRYEVRRVVRETLEAELSRGARESTHEPSCTPPQEQRTAVSSGTEILTRSDLEARVRRGEPLVFSPSTRFTMLAEEFLKARGLDRREDHECDAGSVAGLREVIAVGADHRGYALKKRLQRLLEERGFEVLDCGADDDQPSDYPVLVRRVAEAVANGAACAGVFVDGSGMGSAMAANKISGVRAAHCRTTDEARSARVHNHAQVLTLNADIGELTDVVDTFLRTPFGPGRHARRVDMIEEREQK